MIFSYQSKKLPIVPSQYELLLHKLGIAETDLKAIRSNPEVEVFVRSHASTHYCPPWLVSWYGIGVNV